MWPREPNPSKNRSSARWPGSASSITGSIWLKGFPRRSRPKKWFKKPLEPFSRETTSILTPVKKSTKITGKKVGHPTGEKTYHFFSSLNIFTFDRCFSYNLFIWFWESRLNVVLREGCLIDRREIIFSGPFDIFTWLSQVQCIKKRSTMIIWLTKQLLTIVVHYSPKTGFPTTLSFVQNQAWSVF